MQRFCGCHTSIAPPLEHGRPGPAHLRRRRGGVHQDGEGRQEPGEKERGLITEPSVAGFCLFRF